jgi:hypothetical protein
MKLIEAWDFENLFEQYLREIFIVGAAIGGLLGFYWGISGWGFLAGILLGTLFAGIGSVLLWFVLFMLMLALRAAIIVAVIAVPAVLFLALVFYAFSK